MNEGLEALNEIKEMLDAPYTSGVIKQGLNVIEKEHKALEIIKEKGIILQFIKETYTVEQYNAGVFGTLVKALTKEEYELLKEVLI